MDEGGLVSPEEVEHINGLSKTQVKLSKIVEELLDDPKAIESYVREKANEMQGKITLHEPIKTDDIRVSHRYDRMAGKYVIRHPYYYCDDLIPYLVPHPLHYILFSQFAFYRWMIGGVWLHYQDHIWVRMEDRHDDEFCHQHSEMEPCPYCKADDEGDYGR